ncbi:hypothetical protein NQ314_012420 [Rhamnusium bicolor]|uniref:Regulatory protein zeste n=1 Tax=Rhamnusium bicolor TaxID=1586634 RepID=A0AAV8XCV1_9CUCU|nr:hypothetical protein NQ314_012420 [Rhamnusium bicolor]
MECWEKLAWEYNSMQTSGLRTGIKLKSAYEQMKKQAKQHKSQDKVELLKTGGGTFKPTLTDLDEKVLSVIEDNYFCIENDFDSNNNLPKLLTPSTSADPDDTVSGFENILIVYENSDHQNKINEIAQDFQEQPVPKKRKICTQIKELLPADTNQRRQEFNRKQKNEHNGRQMFLLIIKEVKTNIIFNLHIFLQVCDNALKIMNVNAKYPGSTNDAFIWNNSNLQILLRHLHMAGYKDFYLLGMLQKERNIVNDRIERVNPELAEGRRMRSRIIQNFFN